MDTVDFRAWTRFAVLDRCEEGIRFSLQASRDVTLGSNVRERELCRAIGRIIRRARPLTLKIDPPFVVATLSFVEAKTIMELMSAVDLRIGRFRKERLHPRVVEGLLGITPAERRRWTKDGRLPVSGNGSFRRGRQVIQFPLHPPDKIALLTQTPETVAEWRERDRALASPSNPRSSQPEQ